MNIKDWRRANELFEEVLDLPEEEQKAWLDQTCSDQPSIREEIERRLKADAAAEARNFLAEPVIPSRTLSTGEPSPVLADSAKPDHFGPYRVLGEIGRGGMGVVYAAQRVDDTFHRKVAVKVMAAGSGDDELARRLRTERRILALLEHPNIARIYDGGTTEDGRPYFVMEHVIGVPIDEYCSAHRLSIRQRVTLIRRVCAAVDYAHRNLVIHRDLKPSNILITEEGDVKLLDFGLAKVLENEDQRERISEATVPWRQRLTLNYASPEQLRGQAVSTASDVYSLGVILFLLLTGTHPRSFEGLSPWEAEQKIGSDPPPRASVRAKSRNPIAHPVAEESIKIGRQLEGDLDAIVLKALRFDPNARYRSADQFAEDLNRYLSALPVAARRGTFRYRLGKLLQRHSLAAATTAVVLVLGIALTVSSVFSANRLSQSQTRLLEEQAKLERTQSFLLGVFQQAGPYVAEGVPLTLREAVDAQAERLSDSFGAPPEVYAATLTTLGWVYFELGSLDQALDLHERALAVRQESSLSDGALAGILDGIAAALREQWQFDRADQMSSEALELHRRSEENPPGLLRSLNHRVKLFCLQKNWDLADPLTVEAMELVRIRFDDNDPESAIALVQRGQVLKHLGRRDDARQLYQEAEALFARIYGPRHPILAPLYNNLGVIEEEAERFHSAEKYWRRSDAQYATAFGDDFYDRVIPLTHLGRLLHHTGAVERAETALRTSLEVAVRSPALGPRHEIAYWGRSAVALGALLAATGRCSEVEALLGTKVEEWRIRSKNPLIGEAQALLEDCRAILENAIPENFEPK
ncbi:MAG: protein kinase [Deltaproteobacteria bacterium]|nr:protein kinase [Deltaproteobacteria bacterium]